MPWAKSKNFLGKIQTSSIFLYLICLGGYAIPYAPLHEVYDSYRADIFGFTFFNILISKLDILACFLILFK